MKIIVTTLDGETITLAGEDTLEIIENEEDVDERNDFLEACENEDQNNCGKDPESG